MAIWSHFGLLLSLIVPADSQLWWLLRSNDPNRSFWTYAIKGLEALLGLDYITGGGGDLFLFVGLMWFTKEAFGSIFFHTPTHVAPIQVYTKIPDKEILSVSGKILRVKVQIRRFEFLNQTRNCLYVKETQNSPSSDRKGWNKSSERIQWKSGDEYPADSA